MIDFTINLRQAVIDLRQCCEDLYSSSLEISKKYEDISVIMKGLDEFKYEADESDEIDVYIAKYINATGINMNAKRVQVGTYEFGSKQMSFVMRYHGLHSKSANGKKTTDCHEFLDGYYTKQMAKREFLKQNKDLASADQSSQMTDQTLDTTPNRHRKNQLGDQLALTPSPLKTSPLKEYNRNSNRSPGKTPTGKNQQD